MKKIFCFFFSLLIAFPTYAFQSQAERAEYYLKVFNTYNLDAQVRMLDRLEWSGLSDPLLFDRLEEAVLGVALKENISRNEIKLSAHTIKALGYSGQEKYRESINQIREKTSSSKLSRYAGLAAEDLNKFAQWHAQINQVDMALEGGSIEVTIYMKMLNIHDIQLNKLAARAIFHERRTDSDLLALAADKLQHYYLDPSLDSEGQDAAAWLCKAIGQSGNVAYSDFLNEVALNSPHRKIQKYARKFAI
eukprot:gnl/Carplike_NY0171/9331_a13021_145.p1 GENE.gnl/Carplike_NY0171/9331_a13021_145~~gnl/Carplike_NY0171/9331_a13021_145.p1  ORF type:complete len:248 (-),score=7.83 gnl/Carplike_NY0171/9331_a13021_145:135-878(-)